MSHTFQRIKAPATTPQSTLGFTAVLLALIAGLLAWHFHSRVEDFQDNQRRLMQGNVNATAIAISNYVRHLRRSVELFANDRETLLSPLAQAPDNPQMYQQLLTDIGNHFPQHLAFTIADSQGEPLLQKMDALVGNGCRKDIRRFANELDAHRLYIHSSPQDNPYHFDIMVQRPGTKDEGGVFFVSFFVQDIADILRNESLPGHKLLLAREDRPNTVEVTGDGAGTEMLRDSLLSEDEQQSTGTRAAVVGTRWVVYDLPDSELLAQFQRRARNEAITAFGLFAGITLLLLRLVYRAERALRGSNRDLARSLTQLEEAQDHLVQSEKLAALGGLVAGIAHEINTPIGTAITAASHFDEERLQTDKALALGHLKKSQLQGFMDTAGEAMCIVLANLSRAAELIDPFFTRNREHGGTGLGMHIVYNLMEGKLGGRIKCDSQPEQGTRFSLDLPRQVAPDHPRST